MLLPVANIGPPIFAGNNADLPFCFQQKNHLLNMTDHWVFFFCYGV
jgi:hypothetical protein